MLMLAGTAVLKYPQHGTSDNYLIELEIEKFLFRKRLHQKGKVHSLEASSPSTALILRAVPAELFYDVTSVKMTWIIHLFYL